MVASGRTWASSTTSSNVGHLSILSDGQSASDVVYVNHIIHHFEHLKHNGCIGSENRKIEEIEKELDKGDARNIDFLSQENIDNLAEYGFSFQFHVADGFIYLVWRPNPTTNNLVKDYSVEMSKDSVNFTELVGVVSSNNRGNTIAIDENKERFTTKGVTIKYQKYYKLIVNKKDGSTDEVFLKGPSLRLQYFKNHLDENISELPIPVLAPNGQEYHVFKIQGGSGSYKFATTKSSIQSCNIYSNEVVLICGDLNIDNNENLLVQEGGVLCVTGNLNYSLNPGSWMNGAYSISNEGIILVGGDYSDKSTIPRGSNNYVSGNTLSLEKGTFVIGGTFTRNSDIRTGGIWASTYSNFHGGLLRGIVIPETTIADVFQHQKFPLKTDAVKMAIQAYETSLKPSDQCQNGLNQIKAEITKGENLAPVTKRLLNVEDLIKRAGSIGVKEGKNYELQGSQLFTTSSHEQKNVFIGQDTTLTICGDLILNQNTFLSVYGNLIVTGDLIFENSNPFTFDKYHSLNIGNILVGGDFKGKNLMSESFPGVSTSSAGKTFVLGKIYNHNQSGNNWVEETGDTNNIFNINAIGDITNIASVDKFEDIIEAYEGMQNKCGTASEEKIIIADSILADAIRMRSATAVAEYIKKGHKAKITLEIKRSNQYNSYDLFRRVNDGSNTQQLVKSFGKAKGNSKKVTYVQYDEGLSKVKTLFDSVQYIIVGSSNTVSPSNRRSNGGHGNHNGWNNPNNPHYHNVVTNVLNVPASVLPITLSTFTATMDDGFIDLDWVDEQEVNTSHFIIQRSTDGRNYTTISEEIQAAGNSNKEEVYAFTDEDVPNESMIYYKLIEYDFDGKSEEWVRIVHQEGNSAYNVNIFPIPADTKLNVEVQNIDEEDGEMTIRLIHATDGLQYVLEGKDDFDNMEFNVSSVPPGVYIIEIFTGNKMIHNQKIIIR
ncbi:T9SS type A sorting domain-containing protein [Flammeovirga pectinis]|uniref:T9SS type A sorting domain-containing protein n=1 Tax=Flammeovirga pectinis TaxID=2494373 RepID=A0A3Q9FM83_9BACT|nr:T9SS type A sorting domain-containing protein [Flammeovirga pectinis]AZQ61421.1 T9SS type A sorting domain-containing protein [Flammeovirga pectinis]